MKFQKFLMATLTAMFAITMTTGVLTSCKADDDNNEPAKEKESDTDGNTDGDTATVPDYTIIYYGNGGGNVDHVVLDIIGQFYKADSASYKNVNITVLYKFSTPENMQKAGFSPEAAQEKGQKTFRFKVDPTKSYAEQFDDPENLLKAENYDIGCADSLATYIKWAVEKAPAKKYMLILNDHGGGFLPHDELPETSNAGVKAGVTRCIMKDDGNNTHLTAKSLARGLREAGVRFETIFMQACLMNNLEYLFELKDLCDYTIASTYIMPGFDGRHDVLVNLLSKCQNEVEKSLQAYTDSCVADWDQVYEQGGMEKMYHDLTVTRTNCLAAFGEELKVFTDKLCDAYDRGGEIAEKIDFCTNLAFKAQKNRPFYDMYRFIEMIFDVLKNYDVYDEAFKVRIKEAFRHCIAAQSYSKYIRDHGFNVNYSVLMGFEGNYTDIYWATDEQTGMEYPTAMVVYEADGSISVWNCEKVDSEENRYKPVKIGYAENGWGGTLENTYKTLAFDKMVGWSRWMEKNKKIPGIFCLSDLHFELPDPDTTKIPEVEK